MRNKIFLIILLSILILTSIITIIKLNEIQGSYVWYSGPRAIKNINDTYIGIVDIKGNIKTVKNTNKHIKSKTIYIKKNYEKNEHDHPVFLILPKKRIMTIYSKHNQPLSFNYKISNSSFSKLSDEKTAVISDNKKTTFTYPNPFILKDSPNSFYIFHRGINWHPTISKFTLPDKNGDIKLLNSTQIIQSTGARPYSKYISDGKNKIYMAYTTGHAYNEFPNWIYFSILDTNTYKLYDIEGNLLKNINEDPFNISKEMENSSLIVDKTENSRNCIWDLAFDKKNNPIIAFVKISEDMQKHDYYLAKWIGNKWIQAKIADGGKYFHSIKGSEETFSGGLSIDKDNPNIIWMSVPRKGIFGEKYEIVKTEINDKLEVTNSIQITKNSLKNNIRPITAKGFHKVIWLNGKYDYYRVDEKHFGFPLVLKTKNK